MIAGSNKKYQIDYKILTCNEDLENRSNMPQEYVIELGNLTKNSAEIALYDSFQIGLIDLNINFFDHKITEWASTVTAGIWDTSFCDNLQYDLCIDEACSELLPSSAQVYLLEDSEQQVLSGTISDARQGNLPTYYKDERIGDAHYPNQFGLSLRLITGDFVADWPYNKRNLINKDYQPNENQSQFSCIRLDRFTAAHFYYGPEDHMINSLTIGQKDSSFSYLDLKLEVQLDDVVKFTEDEYPMQDNSTHFTWFFDEKTLGRKLTLTFKPTDATLFLPICYLNLDGYRPYYEIGQKKYNTQILPNTYSERKYLAFDFLNIQKRTFYVRAKSLSGITRTQRFKLQDCEAYILASHQEITYKVTHRNPAITVYISDARLQYLADNKPESCTFQGFNYSQVKPEGQSQLEFTANTQLFSIAQDKQSLTVDLQNVNFANSLVITYNISVLQEFSQTQFQLTLKVDVSSLLTEKDENFVVWTIFELRAPVFIVDLRSESNDTSVLQNATTIIEELLSYDFGNIDVKSEQGIQVYFQQESSNEYAKIILTQLEGQKVNLLIQVDKKKLQGAILPNVVLQELTFIVQDGPDKYTIQSKIEIYRDSINGVDYASIADNLSDEYKDNQGITNQITSQNFELTEQQIIKEAWRLKTRNYNDEEVKFLIEAKNHQLVKRVELKDVVEDELPPLPVMKIEQVSELGVVRISFNQDMFIPENAQLLQFDQIFRFIIISSDDMSQVLGSYDGIFTEEENSDRRRRLEGGVIVTRNCEDDCDARRKNFGWQIYSYWPNEILIFLSYDDPDAISAQMQDTIQMEVLDINMFYSEATGEKLQIENIERNRCDLRLVNKELGTSCNFIPPQIDEGTKRAIDDVAGHLSESIKTLMGSNAFLMIFIGASAQELMGMIRQLTAFINTSLIDVPLPGNYRYYSKAASKVAEIDLFQGPEIYEEVFNFRDTENFSPVFEYYEVEGMNFFMGAASVPIVFLLGILFSFSQKILLCMAKKCYTYSIWRRIGMYASEDKGIRFLSLKILYETLMELLMASTLSIIAFYSTVDADHPSVWFWTFDDSLNSVVAHVVFLALLLLPTAIVYFFVLINEKRKNGWFGKAIWALLEEGFNMNDPNARIYISYQLNKRLIQTLTLLVLDGEVNFQLMLIFVTQMTGLMLLFNGGSKMFNEKRTFWIEVFNDICIYILLLILPIFFLSIKGQFDAQVQFRKTLGMILIYLLGFNFVGNILTAFVMIGFDIFEQIKKGTELIVSRYRFRKKMAALEYLKRSNHAHSLCEKMEKENLIQDAIKFCTEYSPERTWMKENNLDLSLVQEESEFIRLIRQHDLISRAKLREKVKKYEEQLFKMRIDKELKKYRAQNTQWQHLREDQIKMNIKNSHEVIGNLVDPDEVNKIKLQKQMQKQKNLQLAKQNENMIKDQLAVEQKEQSQPNMQKKNKSRLSQKRIAKIRQKFDEYGKNIKEDEDLTADQRVNERIAESDSKLSIQEVFTQIREDLPRALKNSCQRRTREMPAILEQPMAEMNNSYDLQERDKKRAEAHRKLTYIRNEKKNNYNPDCEGLYEYYEQQCLTRLVELDKQDLVIASIVQKEQEQEREKEEKANIEAKKEAELQQLMESKQVVCHPTMKSLTNVARALYLKKQGKMPKAKSTADIEAKFKLKSMLIDKDPPSDAEIEPYSREYFRSIRNTPAAESFWFIVMMLLLEKKYKKVAEQAKQQDLNDAFRDILQNAKKVDKHLVDSNLLRDQASREDNKNLFIKDDDIKKYLEPTYKKRPEREAILEIDEIEQEDIEKLLEKKELDKQERAFKRKQRLVDRKLMHQRALRFKRNENYDFLEDDVIEKVQKLQEKEQQEEMKEKEKLQAKLLSVQKPVIEHADNLVRMQLKTKDGQKVKVLDYRYSFMHSVLQILIETPTFIRYFSKLKFANYKWELALNRMDEKKQTLHYFLHRLFRETQNTSNSVQNTGQVPIIKTSNFRRCLLDSRKDVWRISKQPVPQEFLMNIFRSLYHERVMYQYRHEILDDFKTQIRTQYYCESCEKMKVELESPKYIFNVFVNNESIDLQKMLWVQMGYHSDGKAASRLTSMPCTNPKCDDKQEIDGEQWHKSFSTLMKCSKLLTISFISVDKKQKCVLGQEYYKDDKNGELLDVSESHAKNNDYEVNHDAKLMSHFKINKPGKENDHKIKQNEIGWYGFDNEEGDLLIPMELDIRQLYGEFDPDSIAAAEVVEKLQKEQESSSEDSVFGDSDSQVSEESKSSVDQIDNEDAFVDKQNKQFEETMDFVASRSGDLESSLAKLRGFMSKSPHDTTDFKEGGQPEKVADDIRNTPHDSIDVEIAEMMPKYNPYTRYVLYAAIDLNPETGLYTSHVLKSKVSQKPRGMIWYTFEEGQCKKQTSWANICRNMKCPQMVFYRRIDKKVA